MILCLELCALFERDGETMHIYPAKNHFDPRCTIIRPTIGDFIPDLIRIITESGGLIGISAKNVNNAILYVVTMLCVDYIKGLHVSGVPGKFINMPHLSDLTIRTSEKNFTMPAHIADCVKYFCCNVPVVSDQGYLLFKKAEIVHFNSPEVVCLPANCHYPKKINAYLKG